MGRATYEVGLLRGITDPYPSLRSYIFSHTMKESPNPRVELVSGNPAEFVTNLKEQPGRDIYLCGGGKLASALLEADLIDEIIVKLNPLLIGSGIPMFAHVPKPIQLQLIDCKAYSSGVVLLTYRPLRADV
jgi:dihydrofolate reductase